MVSLTADEAVRLRAGDRSVLDQKHGSADMSTQWTNEHGFTREDITKYSLAKVILAQIDARRDFPKSGREWEMSNALWGTRENDGEGWCIPPEVFRRDLTAGTATAGQELVQTDVSGSVIAALRNAPVVREAGATILAGLRGDVRIPRETAGPVGTWVLENAAPSTESEPTFDTVTLTPREIRAYTELSRRLSIQSSANIEMFVQSTLSRAIAVAVDYAALNGTGSGAEPEGILQTSGIGDVATSGGSTTANRALLLGLINLVESNNALDGSATFVMDPTSYKQLASTETSTGSGRFVLESDVFQGYRVLRSNQMPYSATNSEGTILFGTFSELLIGEWDSPLLLVDPYSLSKQAAIRISISHMVDVSPRQVVAFAGCADVSAT